MYNGIPQIKNDVPDQKEHIDFLLSEINRISKQLDRDVYEVDNPHLVSKQVKHYTDLQFLCGELVAISIAAHEITRLKKKDQYNTWITTLQGTEAYKKAEAEKQVMKIAQEEAEQKAKLARWERAYNNAEQQANALKKYLEIVWHEYRAAGGQ